jgi:hypothetical protein
VKFSHPLTIDEVAVDHPDITFVIAHAGNPWIESAAEVAYKNPNVYLDGSAFVIGDCSTSKYHHTYSLRCLQTAILSSKALLVRILTYFKVKT